MMRRSERVLNRMRLDSHDVDGRNPTVGSSATASRTSAAIADTSPLFLFRAAMTSPPYTLPNEQQVDHEL